MATRTAATAGRDFTEVTERPGAPASALQLARLEDRYRFAASQAAGRRLLEVACGHGIGLTLLARYAASVVAGDIEADHVRSAAGHGAPALQFDATRLPFRDGTFDVIYIAEATYYLPDIEAFVREAARVLAADGRLVITTVNPRWPGWLGSAHATRYHDARELSSLLTAHGFVPSVAGAFPDGRRTRVISVARRVASRLRLVPGSLAGRVLLKRLVYGSLQPLPVALSPTLDIEAPRAGDGRLPQWAPLAEGDLGERYAILHVVGERTEERDEHREARPPSAGRG